jgi:hypothetical protein
MSDQSSFVTVSRLGEVKMDKNDREYRTIYFKGEEKVYLNRGGKLLEVNQITRESSTNAYAKSYLNDQPEAAWAFKVGTMVLGAIVTRKVAPYEIPFGENDVRTVDTYTRVVFGDTAKVEEFEALVQREFAAQGREIVDSKVFTAAEVAAPHAMA